MSVLTLPDGTTYELDGSSQSVPPTRGTVKNEPFVEPYADAPEAPSMPPEALGSTVSNEDVKVALNTVPPKWTATAIRFAKTLAAALGAAFVATGGTVEGILRDPATFLAAIGTALIMAFQKFVSWKDET
jgi:hypothetical protein